MNIRLSTRRWLLAGMVALVTAGPIAGVANAADHHLTISTLGDKPGDKPSDGRPGDKPGNKPGEGKPSGDAANTALSRAYARQQQEVANLGKRLERAAKRAERVAKWLSEAKAKGKDTSALEQALASFNEQIKQAQGSWGEAKATLAAHAGFDDSGKVSDAAAAKATLETSAKQLQTTRETLRKAYGALRKAVADWRKANPKTPDPQVPSEE